MFHCYIYFLMCFYCVDTVGVVDLEMLPIYLPVMRKPVLLSTNMCVIRSAICLC